jgi:hypothetical protein
LHIPLLLENASKANFLAANNSGGLVILEHDGIVSNENQASVNEAAWCSDLYRAVDKVVESKWTWATSFYWWRRWWRWWWHLLGNTQNVTWENELWVRNMGIRSYQSIQ